jgi:hypothetical protein
MLPGCIVLKNDERYIQGIPDLIILYGASWGMLEVKRSDIAPVRPNQFYYVNLLNEMSFAAFISPETEEDVLYDLQQTFKSSRPTRFP